MKKKTFSGWTWITLACFLFFAVFFIYPISRIFLNSVYDFNTGTFSLKAFEKFFGKKYYTNTIWNSLRVTTCATEPMGSVLWRSRRMDIWAS